MRTVGTMPGSPDVPEPRKRPSGAQQRKRAKQNQEARKYWVSPENRRKAVDCGPGYHWDGDKGRLPNRPCGYVDPK